MIPHLSPEEQGEKLAQFDRYLEAELGIPVNFEVTEDYETSIALLVQEEVEMAYLGPLSYVKAKAKNPQIEPIVTHIESVSGRSWYAGVIVADQSQGIRTLADLSGKRFGFVNRSSTSGYLVARAKFQALGLEPERDFAAVVYAGSHDKNVVALAQGQVDAIAVEEAVYLGAEAAGDLPDDRYGVVWRSEPLPNPPLVINSQLPPQFKQRLQRALINAPPGLATVGGEQASGYTLAQDQDYEPIRRIQGALGLEN